MTRAYPLWALFGLIVVAGALVARRRRFDVTTVLTAWLLSFVLMWFGAGLLGFLGSVLLKSLHIRSYLDMGFFIGAPLGAFAGALSGIALAELGLRNRRSPWPALALGGVSLLIAAAAVLLILQKLAGPEYQAGKSVYVVYPLLGAAPVLGWLIGNKS
jgi:hypothetical protein